MQHTPPELELIRAEQTRLYFQGHAPVDDLISGGYHCPLGFSDRVVSAAVLRVSRSALRVAFPKARTAAQAQLSQALLAELGQAQEGRLFYTLSGAESVENALKLARLLRGAPLVLSRRRAYHGATLGALAVSGDWRSEAARVSRADTAFIPEPETDPDATGLEAQLLELGPARIAALCLETVTGANGVIDPPARWWTAVLRLRERYGFLLILDEVTTGFGRCGPSFAFQRHALRPDFVCMAKALTAGYVPFGALFVREQLAAHFDTQLLPCGLTNYAHPLGLAATQATLTRLAEPELIANRTQLSETLSAGLGELLKLPTVCATRQVGLLAAVEFEHAAPKWSHFFEAGLHVGVHGRCLLLAPAFILAPKELESRLARLSDCVRAIGEGTP